MTQLPYNSAPTAIFLYFMYLFFSFSHKNSSISPCNWDTFWTSVWICAPKVVILWSQINTCWLSSQIFYLRLIETKRNYTFFPLRNIFPRIKFNLWRSRRQMPWFFSCWLCHPLQLKSNTMIQLNTSYHN